MGVTNQHASEPVNRVAVVRVRTAAVEPNTSLVELALQTNKAGSSPIVKGYRYAEDDGTPRSKAPG